jgi:exosortase
MTLRGRLGVFASYVGLTTAIHAPVALALVRYSRDENSASHVVMIPLVAAALVYMNREAIFASIRTSWPAGAPALAAGAAAALWGAFASPAEGDVNALAFRVAALMILWIGGFLVVFGPRAARAAAFPLAFLAFTVPIPPVALEAMTLVLKTGSADTVAGLFTLTGTPYFRQAFVFELPTIAIEVADACSGIRSTIALTLTSLMAGHLFLERPWAKALLVAVVLPITIFKNAIRIVTLSLLAVHVNPSFLTGQLHHDGGMVFFLLGLALLVPIMVLLRRSESGPARPLQAAHAPLVD